MRHSPRDLIARFELGGDVGFVVKDLETGHFLAREASDVLLPPASVTKAVTALYALEALGPSFQFETKLVATGTLVDGVLQGDLILVGSGDPRLLTDDLVVLRDTLKDIGIQRVAGRFLVWGGAIDRIEEIEPSQLDHLGYNPSVGGLNLNYNRVHFEWERQGSGYRVQMDARGRSDVPLVTMSRMQVVDRGAPVFAYQDGNGVDLWTVARSALNNSGSRWIPVRYPAIYTGDVFKALARSVDIALPDPILASAEPEGTTLAQVNSPLLANVMREMLDKSTNLTAEAAGLTASAKLSGSKRGLRTSAFQMSTWARDRAGIRAQFDDHSGLSDATRISAGDMVELLAADGVQATLDPILKDIPFLDDKGRPLYDYPAVVKAKTGTLNFVTTLAGYMQSTNGRNLAFAFFAADLERREAGKRSQAEQPSGAAYYNTRARLLQQSLLRHVDQIASV